MLSKNVTTELVNYNATEAEGQSLSLVVIGWAWPPSLTPHPASTNRGIIEWSWENGNNRTEWNATEQIDIRVSERKHWQWNGFGNQGQNQSNNSLWCYSAQISIQIFRLLSPSADPSFYSTPYSTPYIPRIKHNNPIQFLEEKKTKIPFNLKCLLLKVSSIIQQ